VFCPFLSVQTGTHVSHTGRSAAWLARRFWEPKVGGSNPLAPIQKIKGLW
jgi:hypothetical protein